MTLSLSTLEPGADSKYRVVADLGEGGMAIVSLAVVRGTMGFTKLVVLKKLRAVFANDEELREALYTEANIAARLNHPNVIQTNEIIEHDGVPTIVMEYLEGQPLSNILSRIRAGLEMPLSVQLRIVVDVLNGLHYAHELKDYDGSPLCLVHRDVSPHNVFVTYEGNVKVLDFGIAKSIASKAQTATGIIKGKVKYMAPEQMSGEAIDRRADIFAIGVILWEMLARRRLWKGIENENAIMQAVLCNALPSPRSVCSDVSAVLDGICMHALAVDPAARFATASDMASALEDAVSSLADRTSQREIARIMTSTYAVERERGRRTVEQALTPASSVLPILDPRGFAAAFTGLSATETAASMSAAASGVRVTDPEAATRSLSVERAALPLPSPETPKRRLSALWRGVALVVAVAGLATFALRPREVPLPVAVSAPSPTVSSASAAGSATVPEVGIQAFTVPLAATLMLDGVTLASNPATLHFPRGSSQHTLRAEAPGYEPRSITVTTEHDATLTLNLERSAITPVRRTKSAPNVRPPFPPGSAHPTATSTPAPNCDLPYYVGKDGIKRFRPECI